MTFVSYLPRHSCHVDATVERGVGFGLMGSSFTGTRERDPGLAGDQPETGLLSGRMGS